LVCFHPVAEHHHLGSRADRVFVKPIDAMAFQNYMKGLKQ